jgi:hypothetical protein
MAQPRSRVDLYAAIRRDARSGMSNRALQRKHGVGFRTVTSALESAWPKERKQPPKRGSRHDAYRVVRREVWRGVDRLRRRVGVVGLKIGHGRPQHPTMVKRSARTIRA